MNLFDYEAERERRAAVRFWAAVLIGAIAVAAAWVCAGCAAGSSKTQIPNPIKSQSAMSIFSTTNEAAKMDMGATTGTPDRSRALRWLAWDWTPTNGPVVFEVWHSTNGIAPGDFAWLTNVQASPMRLATDKEREWFIVRAKNPWTGQTGNWASGGWNDGRME